MNKLKIHFCDFWSPGIFNPKEFLFYKILSLKFDIELDSENPDVVFFSCFGNQNVRYNGRCKKVLFLGEHWINPANNADISTFDISFTHLHETGVNNNYYFPLWALFVNWFHEEQPRSGDPNYFCDIDIFNGVKKRRFRATDRRFCSLINNRDPSGNRKEVYEELQKRRYVDCYGDLFNNMGGKIGGMQDTKCRLIKNYKFTIAFENLKHQGYNTEKILQPIEAGCIPVYWGGEKASKYFNKNSYIDITDFNSIEQVVERMLEIDEDDQLFESIVNSNPLVDNLQEFYPSNILEWMCSELSL